MVRIVVNAPDYRFVYDPHAETRNVSESAPLLAEDVNGDGALDIGDINLLLSNLPFAALVYGTTDPLQVIAAVEQKARQVAGICKSENVVLKPQDIFIVIEDKDIISITETRNMWGKFSSDFFPNYGDRFIDFVKNTPYRVAFLLNPTKELGDEVLFDPQTVFHESVVQTIEQREEKHIPRSPIICNDMRCDRKSFLGHHINP
ncbi:MAG: hypothetical protein A3I05_07530 [Deltaproteobacteria bacterium RIFCSPLOWO2_02_FULL_44_10]|nr:MAG: hypothetical protein A3C46_00555 [Deltaproteobacteria bacterium RIFCSPHIGHO2_02_FULL_44_16]OGQ47375.1 MAG: hypothetical protein A3I05_07530 [Deltaproteobacteria bacterium RIFCSPLOWO2_02_FULL_44_10]